MDTKPTPAEVLLDVANRIRHTTGLICVDGGPDNCAAVAALALRLRDRPAVALRAQVEGWNKLEIIRQLW